MRAAASLHAGLHSRKKLLLVEDDASVQASLELVLDADYEVHSATTVRSGIDLFARLNPSLVVLDLRLPDGDGLEVLREIRIKDPKAPVIIVTGYASMRTVEDALRLGASDYLHKPFDGRKLRARVRELISSDFGSLPKRKKEDAAECIPMPAKQLALLESKAMASSLFLHDAANPITAALSAAQLLCEEIDMSPEKYSETMREACALLNDSVGLLAGLFEQGTAIARGGLLEKTKISLRQVVELAVRMARVNSKKDQPPISVQIQDENSLVFVNPYALARVLLNLLCNAISAVPPHSGTVTISAKAVDGFAKFSVSDNGPGIPPELMTRIFDAHFTTKAQGSGLGLYICKRLVEVMQGTLSVRNEPNHGCCFSIRIPCAL